MKRNREDIHQFLENLKNNPDPGCSETAPAAGKLLHHYLKESGPNPLSRRGAFKQSSAC